MDFRIRCGVDIVEVERIARIAAERPGFAKRVFTDGELEYCRGKPRENEHLAARFAAKEAVLKAFGTGISQRLSWTEVEVTADENKRPHIQLHGEAAAWAERNGLAEIDVSLSHTESLAIAYAVSLWRASG